MYLNRTHVSMNLLRGEQCASCVIVEMHGDLVVLEYDVLPTTPPWYRRPGS